MEVSRKQNASAPCAACKLLRRRCSRDCVFAPYFPAEEPGKFAGVHKVFGASNVSKMLQVSQFGIDQIFICLINYTHAGPARPGPQELPEEHRGDAVSSMVYEANARMRDPVYGCVGAISYLQQQIDGLRQQLALTQAEMLHLRVRQATSDQATSPSYSGSQLSYTFVSHSKPSSYDMEVGAVEHATFRESMWSSTQIPELEMLLIFIYREMLCYTPDIGAMRAYDYFFSIWACSYFY